MKKIKDYISTVNRYIDIPTDYHLSQTNDIIDGEIFQCSFSIKLRGFTDDLMFGMNNPMLTKDDKPLIKFTLFDIGEPLRHFIASDRDKKNFNKEFKDIGELINIIEIINLYTSNIIHIKETQLQNLSIDDYLMCDIDLNNDITSELRERKINNVLK